MSKETDTIATSKLIRYLQEIDLKQSVRLFNISETYREHLFNTL